MFFETNEIKLVATTNFISIFICISPKMNICLIATNTLYKKSSSMYLRNVYYVGFKNGISAMFIKYNSFIYSIKYACKSTLLNLVYVMNK